jgi:hypothetical protein
MLGSLILAATLAQTPPCIPVHKHHVQHPKISFIEKTCVVLPPTPEPIEPIVLTKVYTKYVIIESIETNDCAPPVVWHDVTYWPTGGGWVGNVGGVGGGSVGGTKPPVIGGIIPHVPPQPYHVPPPAKAPELDVSSSMAEISILFMVLTILFDRRV